MNCLKDSMHAESSKLAYFALSTLGVCRKKVIANPTLKDIIQRNKVEKMKDMLL